MINKKHIFLCQLADAILIPVRGTQVKINETVKTGGKKYYESKCKKSTAKAEYSNIVVISLFVSSHITLRAPPIRYGDYNEICFTFFAPIFSRWCSTSFMLTLIVPVAGSHFPPALYYLYRPCHVANA